MSASNNSQPSFWELLGEPKQSRVGWAQISQDKFQIYSLKLQNKQTEARSGGGRSSPRHRLRQDVETLEPAGTRCSEELSKGQTRPGEAPPIAHALVRMPADPAWYQTWPGPGSRPSGTQKTPTCQHPQNWSATWTKDSKRQDKRWVKYEGIGPVDESGMPIAPRSVSPGLGGR